MATYSVPEQYGGMSLKDIQKTSGLPFRSDVLAGFAGVGETQPLTYGQALNVNLPANYASSGEASALSQLFTPGTIQAPQQQQQMATTQQQQQQYATQAIQPAVETLQAGKEPLKQKYDELIASIKGTGAQEVKRAETGAAQGYAARGLSVNSPAFQQYASEKTAPIAAQFEQLGAQVGLDQQQMSQTIDNAIATLQAQAGMSAFDAANAVEAALKTLQESQRQFDINQTYKQQELAQTGQYASEQQRSAQAAEQLAREKFEYEKSKPTGGADTGIASLLQQVFGQGLSSQTEPKPTTNPGAASATSPQGQWYWDYNSGNWIPIVD